MTYHPAVRTRRALVPLLLVVSGALTACGGDDSDDSSADDEPTTSQEASGGDSTDSPDGGDGGEVSACGVLSADEVEAAVGSPVKEGIASSGPAVTGGSFTTCIWQSADPDHPADTATLTIYPNADAADSVRSEDSEDLEGIGDEAFSDSVSSVWVYVGDQSFFAQWYVFGTMDDEGLEQSKALATAAADNLAS
jgi:hypothetical protein